VLTADLVREIAAGAALKPQQHRLFKLEDIAMGSWVQFIGAERGMKVGGCFSLCYFDILVQVGGNCDRLLGPVYRRRARRQDMLPSLNLQLIDFRFRIQISRVCAGPGNGMDCQPPEAICGTDVAA